MLTHQRPLHYKTQQYDSRYDALGSLHRAATRLKTSQVFLGVVTALVASFACPYEPSLPRLPLGLPPRTATFRDNQALVELGQRIFVDKRLSADGTISCATCHEPEGSFSSSRPTVVGVHGRQGTRNAPSLLNVAYQASLFWDGRATSLESQALVPVLNPVEHGLPTETSLIEIIRNDPIYAAQFSDVLHKHGDQLRPSDVASAISAYERTLLSGSSPFDQYYYGKQRNAISAAAIRGLAIFQGKGRCSTCHTISEKSALLTDQQFHTSSLGITSPAAEHLADLAAEVQRLKFVGDPQRLSETISTDPEIAELGRFVVTLNPADIGTFKTPSLRNIALTAPYMHNGSVSTLSRAIELESYNRSQSGDRPIVMTIDERSDLEEFLRALTSIPKSNKSQAEQ